MLVNFRRFVPGYYTETNKDGSITNLLHVFYDKNGNLVYDIFFGVEFEWRHGQSPFSAQLKEAFRESQWRNTRLTMDEVEQFLFVREIKR